MTLSRAALTPRARAVLLVLCAAQFMLILDIVILNVALPSIRRDLGIPDARLHLTGIAYTLTFGSLLIVAGRAGDLAGRRRLLLAGLATFTLASLLTGVAQAEWQLLAGRAFQGVGAALVSPNALALLTASFAEGDRRNRALGVWGAVGSGGAVAGQLLGGVITHYAGWRWTFLINVPAGIVAVAAAARLLDESRAPERQRLDLPGAATLAVGLSLLALALAGAVERGFGGAVAASLLGAAVLLVAFVAIERRQRAPLVRFGLLTHPGVLVGNLTLALNAGALGAALFFTTLYLQVVLGYSALAAGAAFAPITMIVLLVSPYAGRLAGRVGVRRLLVAGLSLLAAGMLLLARVPLDGDYLTDVLPGMALLALGSGLAYAPTFIAGTTGVPDADQGLASGLLNTAQELGAALGLAVLATVAAATMAATGGAPADPASLTGGYRAGFLGAASLMALGVLVASRLPSRSALPGSPTAW